MGIHINGEQFISNKLLDLSISILIREKHSDTVNSGHMSRMAKKMLRNAAINASKMKLTEEWAKLQNDYDEHKQNPCSHPMYAKEWNIFYYRTMGDLIAGNFI